MNFVNFWMRDIVLALGATACPLDLPDGDYRLVVADGLGAQAAAWEIIDATVVDGAATLTRGLEGTDDQAWPIGSVIYSSVTAGILQALADNSGSGGDDTVIEHIIESVETLFFGKPSSAPTRLGQVCRQIDVNGVVCEWVAYMYWDETLQWRRSVLPLADWGLFVADTYSAAVLDTDRAYALTTDPFAENPVTTTLQMQPAVAVEGVQQFPIVIANWSAHAWTLNLDPGAFWQSGGTVILQGFGFDALGITSSTDVDGVVTCVVPADTRVWFDLSAIAGGEGGDFGMSCEITARPLSIYQN